MKLIAINKKLQTSLLLGVLCLSSSVFAAPGDNATGDILAQIKSMLEDQQAENEAVQRELLQDWKNFFGLTTLKEIETQNVMRLMMPPYIDQTMAISARLANAEEAMVPFQDALVRDTANYNMNTENNSDNTREDQLLAKMKEEKGLAGMDDPYSGFNSLLATTLLNGLAFPDDKTAEDAYLYIKNVTNFEPLPAMKEEDMFILDPSGNRTDLTPEGGKHLIQLYKQLPAMTMAQNSLLAIHAEKQRFKEFAQGLPIGDPTTKSASLMEVLAYEVDRRYMSADWHNEMNQMSAEGTLKEIANMMAYQMYLDFMQYRQSQRLEALIAGQVGLMSALMNGNPTANVNPDEIFEQL